MMTDQDRSGEAKRDEWREGGTRLRPEDAPGHTLPESERDPAGSDDVDRGGGGSAPGTMPPPD